VRIANGFFSTMGLLLAPAFFFLVWTLTMHPWQFCVGDNPRTCSESANYGRAREMTPDQYMASIGKIECDSEGGLHVSNIEFIDAQWQPFFDHQYEFCRGRGKP
jgi:hypothetical protein